MDPQENDNNLVDEFVPELEISVIPSKLSDSYKVDLFGLDERFMAWLALRKILFGKSNDDVIILSAKKVMPFILSIRDAYRVYKATGEK